MVDISEFVALARLAQESFEARRRYEWRINFTLWGGLAAVAYWASKANVRIFESSCGAYAFGAIVLLLYLLSLILINYGHHQDKAWKHYYMARAIGDDKAVKPKPRSKASGAISQGLWCFCQGGFTAVFVYLVLRVLLAVHPATSTHP